MKNEIRDFIHRMDSLADDSQNLMLLETMIEIRDIFLELTDVDAEGLIDASWVTKCMVSLYELNRAMQFVPEKIVHLIQLLIEPYTCYVSESKVYTAVEMRKMCTIQRNKIRYSRKIKTIVERLMTCLPATEMQEVREMLYRQKQNAVEYFGYLLSLYKQRCREEQSKRHKEKYEELEQLEMKPDEKHNLVETEDMIHEIRDVIRDREERFIHYLEIGRINEHAPSLSRCTDTERGMTNVREDDETSAAEEKETTEGD